MNEVSERFFQVVEKLGLSNSDLIEMCEGMTKQKISNARSGRNQVPMELIRALMRQYLVNGNYILEGIGSMINDVNLMYDENNGKAYKSGIKENFVYVSYVPACATASFVDSLYDVQYEMETYGVMQEGDEILDEKYMVFQIKGDSMEPTIHDDSKILAKRIDESQWESASGIVVVVYNKILTLKRIKKNSLYPSNYLVLMADNPKHGEIPVARHEIRGMWQLVRVVSYVP